VEDIRASGGGGQDILVGLVADETGGGDAPRITSVCHCSSRVSEPGGLVFSSSRAGECGFAVVDSVLGREVVLQKIEENLWDEAVLCC
jgi:hypothetical protein